MIPNFDNSLTPPQQQQQHLSNTSSDSINNNNPYNTSYYDHHQQQQHQQGSPKYQHAFGDNGTPSTSPFNNSSNDPLNQLQQTEKPSSTAQNEDHIVSSNKYMLDSTNSIHANLATMNKGIMFSSPYSSLAQQLNHKDHQPANTPHHPFFPAFQTTTFHHSQRFGGGGGGIPPNGHHQFGMPAPGYFPTHNPYLSGGGAFYDHRIHEMEARLPLDYARVWLDHQTLWRRFSVCGNEMIITKMGR